VAFLAELGLELEGETTVEGRSVDRAVGLDGVRSDIVMMRTPDGHARLELAKFHTPPSRGGDPGAPANALDIRHVTFAVEGIDDVLDRLRAHGAEVVGELEQYENTYRLCYVRGPTGSSSNWPSGLADRWEMIGALRSTGLEGDEARSGRRSRAALA
jgi:catechol 2,3-dioxygenase-like lactoylglutathione lyase family enzyme